VDTIGTLILTWRDEAGLSQAALADAVGWHRSQVNRLERDHLQRLDVAHLRRIAEVLGRTDEDFQGACDLWTAQRGAA